MPDDAHPINAEMVQDRRSELSLPWDRITRSRRGCATMSDQVEPDDLMGGGQRWSNVVPPVEGAAEAVDEQDGRAIAFRLDVRRLDAGINDLAAVTR